MNLYLSMPVVGFIITLILSFLVIWRQRRSFAHRLFFFFLLSVALYCITLFFMRASPDFESALLWEKAMIAMVPTLSLFFLHFTFAYTGIRPKRGVIPVLYVLLLVVFVLSPSDLFIRGMSRDTYGYYPLSGPLFRLLMPATYLLLTYALINLIKAYRASNVHEERNCYLYIFIGMGFAAVTAIPDVLSALGIILPPMGVIGTLLLCIFTTIAILKYHLLDIHVVFRKGMAYVLVSAAVAIPYAGLLYLMSYMFEAILQPWWAHTFIILLLAIILRPLYSWSQQFADLLFYRDRYDYLKALEQFTRETQTLTRVEKIGSTMVELVNGALRSSSACLLLPDENTDGFTVVSSACLDRPPSGIVLRNNSPLVKWLKFHKGILFSEEIHIIPQLQSLTCREEDNLEQMRAELFVPIKSREGELSGLLVLGPKISQQSYSSEDTRLLSTLAGQMSMNIENVKLYSDVLRSRENLQVWLGSMSDCVLIVSADHIVQFVNTAAEEKFGINNGQVCWSSLGKGSRCSDCPMEHASHKNRGGSQFTNIIWDREFDVAAAPLSNPDGSLSIIEVLRDITERRQAEEAARVSEKRLRDLYEEAPIAYLTVDLKRIIGNCNRMAEEISGYDREELNGKDVMELFSETHDGKDKANAIFERFLRGERIRNEQIRIIKKDGTLTWGSLTLNGILDEDENIIASRCMISDINHRVELEAQFLQAQKMEALGTLAGGIAHDFNNLLMGIQGRASLMLIGADSSHPHFEHLKEVEEYVKSAAGLTGQLLGFARGGKYEVISTDLNEHIKAQNRMFGRTKKEITIRGKYEEDLWRTEVDQGQIGQALLNIYVNAWQAMPGGGNLYIETKNIILNEGFAGAYQVEPGRYVKISIRDTGIGMDEETRNKIFDPFFTTKEIGRGTGLGLASVYGIIKNHDGFIDVHSKKDEGSTFDIYLPAIEEKSIEQKTKSDISLEIIRGTGTVLLVDDEDMIIDVGEKILKEIGYEVLTARSGKDALEIVGKAKDHHAPSPDIVILDMVMPDMNGSEAYDRIKEISPDIKVLLSSGYSIAGHAAEILKRGCDGFIQKPFSMRVLARKIREILDTG
ncbi:MAG: PAS domain S-box protein [Deltaproteobacteria bacterium]|nr:PAS domain S-box protein [Deltaproteobacteria bacterium]